MIREIQKSELADLLALYEHLHATDDPVPGADQVDEVWQSIQGNPDIKYFGAYESETLVATCTLTVIPNLTKGCRSYGLVENVVTAPAFRRRGFGKAILEHALEYAWSRNCYKVMLLTGRKNEETYRFYESAGFDRHAKQAFVAKPKEPEQDTGCDS